jgi:hypothetical protein
MKRILKILAVVAIVLLIPIVPFIVIGELPGERWLSARDGSALLILSRPVPVLAEAMAIAAGATRTPVMHMLAACAAGNAVYAGILAADGAALLAADWTGPGIILPLLLPVAGWGLWRWFRP